MFLVGKIASSILWGILIAIALVGIVMLIVKSWNSSKKFGALSLIIALAMLVAVSFQTTYMMGAFKVKQQVNRMEHTLQGGVGEMAASILSSKTWEDASDLMEVAGNLLDDRNFDLRDYSSMERLHHRINSYILVRVAWIVGILLLGGLLTALTMEQVKTLRRPAPAGYGGRSNRTDDF